METAGKYSDGPERDSSTVGVRALTGCALCALIVSTLLGNTLVCVAVIKFRHLRSKVRHFFVISLAVSDLFLAVLVMPWKAVSEVAGCWLFGSFCDTWIAFDIMCSTASILNLCIISLDRYWAISSPFRYRKMTQRVAFVMIGMAWTLSILISFVPVRLNWHKADRVDISPINHGIPSEDCSATLNRTYAIVSSLVSFYAPVIIMIGTYTRIYRIAQTQIRRISTLERAAGHTQSHRECSSQQSLKSTFKKETKVLKTLSVIMGVFVFCWLPFFILNCIVPFCDLDALGNSRCVSSTTFSIFVWFGWANSALNPVIYAFNADFRKAFITILGCNRLCASSGVEAVNFSNELVSYHHATHHQTTLPQKESQDASDPQPLALAPVVPVLALAPFDKDSLASGSSCIQRNVYEGISMPKRNERTADAGCARRTTSARGQPIYTRGNGIPRARLKHSRAHGIQCARNTSPRARMTSSVRAITSTRARRTRIYSFALSPAAFARANIFIFGSRGAGLAVWCNLKRHWFQTNLKAAFPTLTGKEYEAPND